MAGQSRIKFFDRSILFRPGGLLDEKEVSKRFATFARANIEAAAEHNEAALGRPTPYETAVDGVPGKPLSAIKADGVAITQFELGSDVVQWIWDMVKNTSPVKSGRFKQSQLLLADGVPVDSTASAPPDTREFLIVSTVPYARKIEGSATRKPQSAQAPKGVYQVAASMAKRRYGNIANIRFTFRGIVAGAMMDYVPVARRAGSSAETRAKAKTERANRQPAIIITFR
jgi:hypothetical protein